MIVVREFLFSSLHLNSFKEDFCPLVELEFWGMGLCWTVLHYRNVVNKCVKPKFKQAKTYVHYVYLHPYIQVSIKGYLVHV